MFSFHSPQDATHEKTGSVRCQWTTYKPLGTSKRSSNRSQRAKLLIHSSGIHSTSSTPIVLLPEPTAV